MADAFSGFPKGTFTFLRELARNNNKPWFDAHRGDYDAYYVGAGRDLVTALGPRLQKLSPGLQFDPKINGSIFRINRDVRFARDKSPYQSRLDLWFWHGERSGWDAPGIFLWVSPDSVGLGAGMHVFQKPQLDAYRKAVLDERSGKALEKAIAKVRAAGPYEVLGATRKTIPRGFDAHGPRSPLLLHEGLWASHETTPTEAMKPTFVDFCVGHLKAMLPISQWLLAEVATAPAA